MTTVRWSVAVCAFLALAAGCGTDPATGRSEPRVSPSAATSGPGIGDCAARVDALIDSRTIPRSDRDYAIGMCVDNR
ncbi:hypothetical protein [Nocardioides pocheonensis]|uniref:Uncharacterized protein n=1 Tax=Nocardioides pocheonensis TaxID=661485 RepID=A0A3N0GTB4_9ACTN|nr:hypothetical protein [Nocardioides pocheonensis]RNM15715.1 hypothetical protein EFL26_05860 [Nocardioides pocheonensis]